MKVLIWPAGDENDGTSQYRLRMPAAALVDQGADVEIDSDGPSVGWSHRFNGWPPPATVRVVQLMKRPEADTVVMQRSHLRWWSDVIPMLQAEGIRVVIDIDDHFSKIHQANVAHAGYDPTKRDHANFQWVAEACRRADLVTCTTKTLLDAYGFGHGLIIPNLVPERYLRVKADQRPETAGWTGSTDTHPEDLQVTRGAIGQVLANNGWGFHVVGTGVGVQKCLGLKEEPTTTGWVPFNQYIHRMAEISLGVVPLQDSEFNRAKCLDSTTRIATQRGILPLSEVDVGDKVWNDGRWRRVEAREDQDARDGLLLTTSAGRQLRLTAEHRLWVNGAWTEAKDISAGDVVTTTPDEIGADTIVSVPWPSDGRLSRKKGNTGTEFMTAEDAPRVAISERWGRFLGLFAGDGSAAATSLRIHCDGQDADLIELVSEDLRQMGLSPLTEAMTTWGGAPLRRQSVGASSTHLLRFMRSLGVVEGHRRLVCIPEVIWRSPRAVVQQFLAGLFEADGTASGSAVSLTTKYEAFARDVQRLLTALGIESTVRPRVSRIARTGFVGTYWHLNLRRAAVDVFAKEIGFLSERKRSRLDAITAKRHSNAYRPMAWAEEVVSVEPCEMSPIDLQVQGSVFAAAGFVSHNSCLKMMEFAATGVPVLASATPDNERMARLGIGRIVPNHARWRKFLQRMVTDEQTRADSAGQARERMAEHTYEKQSWRWAEAWGLIPQEAKSAS
jgi:hypothetical protein